MSQERMQSVREGEVESELRGLNMDQQKQYPDQPPIMQQPSDTQRFTNIGGSSGGVGQQPSGLQQQQSSQLPLGAQPQQQQLSTGLGQQAIPVQQQNQNPISSQTMQQQQQQQQPQQLAQSIGSQAGQPQGMGQMGQQQLQQPQQQQMRTSGVDPLEDLGVTEYREIAFGKAAYEPQMRIANMQDAQRLAFLAPYHIAKFDDQFIQKVDKAQSVIPLANAVAARVVCYPIPLSPPAVTGTGIGTTQDDRAMIDQGRVGPGVVPPPAVPQQGTTVGAGSLTEQQQMLQASLPLSHQVPPQHYQQAPLTSTQGQQQQQMQQQQPMQQTLGQQALGSQQPQHGFRSSGPAVPGAPSQLYRKTTIVNTAALELDTTSQVWELVPNDPNEIGPGFWERGKNTVVKSTLSPGPLLFLNTSQVESNANRTSFNIIDKPARHLFVFGPTSDVPVLIVERDLKFVRKCIKVFSSDLRMFCKIEGTTSFLRKKIIITGPDEDTPIYTIKQKGFTAGPFKGLSGGTSSDDVNYIIYQNKRAVGCITSRYIPPNTLPGQMLSIGQNENMAMDVFFPYGSQWAPRAALLIAALYFDYLWSEKIE